MIAFRVGLEGHFWILILLLRFLTVKFFGLLMILVRELERSGFLALYFGSRVSLESLLPLFEAKCKVESGLGEH